MTVSRLARILTLFALSSLLPAETISLPEPQRDGGSTLKEALKNRRSTREFAPQPLSIHQLSNMLWAAYGVNRPAEGGRTAPSAWGQDEIDLYVFLEQGVYLYLPGAHALHQVKAGDHRKEAGTADFTTAAAVTLVYVADHRRSPRTAVWEKEKYAYIHTGFIGQNVYLFAASEGLACVIHDSARKEELARVLGLGSNEQVIISQTVGQPVQ